ncbi:MAG TPA: oligosaccharide flippase family protein [Ignavibacteriales bacterium]|nr:oligosaccharide flippase family protein [Ignavibacteriales bacterium]
MQLLKTYYSRYKIYFQSTGLYLFASIFSAIIKVLINPVMARNLSYQDYSIIGYFSAFSILFMPLLNFQIVTYYLRNYYIFSKEKREKAANTMLISLIGIGAIMSSLVLIILYFYLKINEVEYPFWPFALFTVFQLVFNNFLSLLQVTYRLQRDAKRFSKLAIFSSISWLLIAVLLVVVFKLGAVGSMGANLLVAIIFGLYSFKKTFTKLEFDFSIFKDALKFCWPLFVSAMLWYFLSGVDRVFLEKLNDTRSFALYNIGIGLSGYLVIIYTAIAQTFEPDIYKTIATNKYRKLTKIILSINTINAIPVFIFIILATPITHILTGGRYTNAADFARILSLKNISTGFYYSVITVIVGFGFTKAELGLRVLGAIISILMFKLLISIYGFYGAAWGQVLSFLLMATFGIMFIIYIYKVKMIKISN